jgi:hypothetical protein
MLPVSAGVLHRFGEDRIWSKCIGAPRAPVAVPVAEVGFCLSVLLDAVLDVLLQVAVAFLDFP